MICSSSLCPRLLRQHGGSSENFQSRFKINTTGWFGPVETPLMRLDVQRIKMCNVNRRLLAQLFFTSSEDQKNQRMAAPMFVTQLYKQAHKLHSWSSADKHLYLLHGILSATFENCLPPLLPPPLDCFPGASATDPTAVAEQIHESYFWGDLASRPAWREVIRDWRTGGE